MICSRSSLKVFFATGPHAILRLAAPAIVAILAFSAAGLAQERIHVQQEGPPQIHAFTFSGSSFTRVDLAPGDPARTALKSSVPGFSIATTPNFYISGSPSESIAIGITDPEGIGLPLAATTAAAAAALEIDASGDYAFMVGGNVAAYGVMDLRPTSATFARQIVSCRDAAPCALGAGIADAGALVGDILYIARTRGGFAGGVAMIDAVDVSTPANPVVLSSTPIPRFGGVGVNRLVNRLRFGSVGGKNYLFLMRRDLQVIEIDAGDPTVLSHVMTIRAFHPDTTFARTFYDAWASEVAGEPRLFAATSVPIADPSTEFETEILTIDLTAPLSGAPDSSGTRILHSFDVTTVINGGNPLSDNSKVLHPSGDGSVLYFLTGASPVSDPVQSRLLAFDPEKLATGDSAAFLDLVLLNDQDDNEVPDSVTTIAVEFVVSEAVVAPASDPVILDATTTQLDETPGRLVINDVPRTLNITGNTLGSVTHAFLGPDWLTSVNAAATDVSATVPKLAPSGGPVLGVVTSDGAVSAFYNVKVVNPPSFLPATVGYVGNSNDNTVSVLNAASATEVIDAFSTLLAPAGVAASKNGRLLFASAFREGKVAVHCIVADDDGSEVGAPCDWNEMLTSITVGGAPQHLVMHPLKDRLYVNTIAPTIAIVDTSAKPPVLAGQIEISDPDEELWFRGATRSMAVSGDWLYAGNDRDPHLLAVHIEDDNVDADPESPTPDIFGISIPDLAGVVARSDGVAIHPDGSKLYFTNFADTAVRVFSINPSDGSDLDQVSTIPIPGAVGDVRNMVVTPNGRYLAVTSRTGGVTDLFDLQNPFGLCGTPPCHIAAVPTGSSSNNVQSSPNSQFLFVPSGGRNAVTIIDLRDGESTQYKALTASGTGSGPSSIALTPGIETPTGNNVPVTPAENVEIVFDTVSTAGETTVTSANVSEIPLPADFVISGNTTAVYYDVNTTAEFDGPVSICFEYGDGLTQEEEESLALLHEEECTQALVDAGDCLAGELGTIVYVDRTDPGVSPNPDTVNNRICGLVDGFSLFVVARQALRVQTRDRINLKSNGVIGVEVLSSPSFDAATLNPATVSLAGAPVKPKKKGPSISFSDVNGDGLVDALFQFEVSALNLSPGDTEAEFVGTTFGGIVKRTSVPVTVR